MITLYALVAELVFFVVMSLLFEYHWHRHSIPASIITKMRIAYYCIALICIIIMFFSL